MTKLSKCQADGEIWESWHCKQSESSWNTVFGTKIINQVMEFLEWNSNKAEVNLKRNSPILYHLIVCLRRKKRSHETQNIKQIIEKHLKRWYHASQGQKVLLLKGSYLLQQIQLNHDSHVHRKTFSTFVTFSYKVSQMLFKI